MPAKVVQLAQGNTFARSSESSQAVDTATRSWRVILTTPGEAWDVEAAVGVAVGDKYSEGNPIPCVSVDMKPDGESRLVRIVTATYRATPGGTAGTDPKTQEPTVRPAVYSMSSSLSEIATWSGRKNGGSWQAMTNPVGDLYDGVSRLEPVVNIAIEQYSVSDQSNILGYVGFVNSDTFAFSSMSIPPHCCMLQGLSSNPIVERFGNDLFRGFKLSFTFAVRAHWTYTRDGLVPVGWDHAVPQTGFNCKNTLGSNNEPTAMQLKHDDSYVVKKPFELAVNSGSIHRAMTELSGVNSGTRLTPASQPVALNDDGTPRKRTLSPPVLINRWSVQPEMQFGSNFSGFGINLR